MPAGYIHQRQIAFLPPRPCCSQQSRFRLQPEVFRRGKTGQNKTAPDSVWDPVLCHSPVVRTVLLFVDEIALLILREVQAERPARIHDVIRVKVLLERAVDIHLIAADLSLQPGGGHLADAMMVAH